MRLSAPPLPALLPAINLPEATPMSEQPSPEQAVQFIFDACRYFGASLATSHHVAALAAEQIERDQVSHD